MNPIFSRLAHLQKAWPLLFQTSPKWLPQELNGVAANADDSEAAGIPVISLLSSTTTITTSVEVQQHKPTAHGKTTTVARHAATTNGAGVGIDNIAYEKH